MGEGSGAEGRGETFSNPHGLLLVVCLSNVGILAKYRICADGGANRLYDLHTTDEERAKYGLSPFPS